LLEIGRIIGDFTGERMKFYGRKEVANVLRFSAVNYRAGSWFRRGTAARPGAQVDLMFIREDRMITLCEIKYSNHFAERKLVESMERKIEAVKEAFPKYGIQPVLISGKNGELSRESGYFSRVVTLDDFFSPLA
jgi:uncharacterized protein